MTGAEVYKRSLEHLYISHSRIKYSNPAKCRYSLFANEGNHLIFYALPGKKLSRDWRHYYVYDMEFDLTKSINWLFSDKGSQKQWPKRHFAGINHRPGNPYGDIRFNWELNRLQFLPSMAASDAALAKLIISDWLERNPFLHGPMYLSSMEVSLRWISIYWAVCLLANDLSPSMRKNITGLAVASGNYIEHRLSMHSSAGNHLIIEAVGLYWLGKALEYCTSGRRWIVKAREILSEQIVRQINSDGSNQEQSFWYLGFVVDALLHYILLEDRDKISNEMWLRIKNALEFINDMTLPNGVFPDYGDRDDGVVFRIDNSYEESPFCGLLNTGAFFFDQAEWFRKSEIGKQRLSFWQNKQSGNNLEILETRPQEFYYTPKLKTYPDGGMSLMQWGKGRLLFLHSPLGLEGTFGHGHADALSIIFYWDSIPVLIDAGSGQYNCSQDLRNYFRSTIAHNTVEIGGNDQARILGPFMWEGSYQTQLEQNTLSPMLCVQASHNGYQKRYGVIHTRKIEWLAMNQFQICDSFSGPSDARIRGAFHLGTCRSVSNKNNTIEADFVDFGFTIVFPTDLSVHAFFGSKNPFMGWRSAVYGKWEPSHSIIFTTNLKGELQYHISMNII